MPAKELAPTSKYVIDVNFPISDGMEPDNLLLLKSICFKLIILHMLVGIVPTKALYLTSKCVIDANFPISDGIEPVKQWTIMEC